MRKNIFVLTATAVILASCGAASVNQNTSTLWSSGTLSMSVPKDWTLVDAKSVTLPAQGSLVLALRGTEKYGEFENLNIVVDDLASATSSADYADTNFTLMSVKLASSLPLGAKSFSWNDGTVGKLRVFEGKYNTATNLKRYVQTARVCGKKAYVATFTLATDVKDTTNYEAMLKTLNCAASTK